MNELAPWMMALHQHVTRGKHVLLHGNVVDPAFLDQSWNPQHTHAQETPLKGVYQEVTLPQFLRWYFHKMGYVLIGEYSRIDGLQFYDGPDNTAQTTRQQFQALSKEPDSPPGTPSGTGGGTSHDGMPSITQVLRAIRRVICQHEKPATFILHYADKLFSDGQRLAQPELNALVELRAALDRAGEVASGLHNTLVIVASHLGSVPAWLYTGNPLLTLVEVGEPARSERQRFLERYWSDFHGGGVSMTEHDKAVRLFLDLTHGLTHHDLYALCRMSAAEKLSILEPGALVNQYKYGRRRDLWRELESKRLEDMQARLSQRVIGQEHAIRALLDKVITANVGITMSRSSVQGGKPKGVFMFAGPTGVGKTELAKSLAEHILGDESAYQRFDMTEYAQEHTAERLVGAPPGYVGFEQGGELVNAVRRQPFGILLFDEIDKAHPKVLLKFLQVLEDGRLTDGRGQTAYFDQSLLIFTTNATPRVEERKYQEELQQLIVKQESYSKVRDYYLRKIHAYFIDDIQRPELLNRFGQNIIVFDILRPEAIGSICGKFLDLLVASADRERGLVLEIDRERLASLVRKRMLMGDNLENGGRRILPILEQLVENPLNRWVHATRPQPGTSVQIGVKGEAVTLNGQVARETTHG